MEVREEVREREGEREKAGRRRRWVASQWRHSAGRHTGPTEGAPLSGQRESLLLLFFFVDISDLVSFSRSGESQLIQSTLLYIYSTISRSDWTLCHSPNPDCGFPACEQLLYRYIYMRYIDWPPHRLYNLEIYFSDLSPNGQDQKDVPSVGQSCSCADTGHIEHSGTYYVILVRNLPPPPLLPPHTHTYTYNYTYT